MKINFKKGFTLIELLVVIAIIGVLAAVVLAATNSARNKGNDAAIKANLANVRAQAELFYDTNSAYSSTTQTFPLTASCTTTGSVFADATVTNTVAAITAANAAPTCVLGGTTGSKANAWAMSAALKTAGNWCVDSTGASKSGTAGATGACS